MQHDNWQLISTKMISSSCRARRINNSPGARDLGGGIVGPRFDLRNMTVPHLEYPVRASGQFLIVGDHDYREPHCLVKLPKYLNNFYRPFCIKVPRRARRRGGSPVYSPWPSLWPLSASHRLRSVPEGGPFGCRYRGVSGV